MGWGGGQIKHGGFKPFEKLLNERVKINGVQQIEKLIMGEGWAE